MREGGPTCTDENENLGGGDPCLQSHRFLLLHPLDGGWRWLFFFFFCVYLKGIISVVFFLSKIKRPVRIFVRCLTSKPFFVFYWVLESQKERKKEVKVHSQQVKAINVFVFLSFKNILKKFKFFLFFYFKLIFFMVLNHFNVLI